MEFFEFLNNEKESVFKKYTFNIIKKFSEENQNMFLRNNLVEFMNNLAKERREKNNFWKHYNNIIYITIYNYFKFSKTLKIYYSVISFF